MYASILYSVCVFYVYVNSPADLLYGILAAVASGYILNCIRSGDQPPFSPALSISSPPSSAWMTQQLVIRVTICCAVGRCLYDIVSLLRRARISDAWLKLTHETDIVLHVVTVQMLALMLVTGEDTHISITSSPISDNSTLQSLPHARVIVIPSPLSHTCLLSTLARRCH
jgi:hypothetical protein